MNFERCAAQHIGMWMIEPGWFASAVAAVKAGTYPRLSAQEIQDRIPSGAFPVTEDGIALISINGQMTKGDSSFGGTSTVRERQNVRIAARNGDVSGIMMIFDSPGGTVAGTADFAGEVTNARAIKPVHAFIEDQGASAAVWVAVQAGRVTATPTSEVGSIGTVAIVEDSSGAAEMAGIKVHVISTGEFKGQLAAGTEVTESQLDELQKRVDAANSFFLKGVADGRQMPMSDVKAIADGRMFGAAEAKGLGLIDQVGTFDKAMADLTTAAKRVQRVNAAAERERARARL